MSHITGSAGQPGVVTGKRDRRALPVLPVLLVLVFLVGGGNLLASWQQVQSFKDQLRQQQLAQQKAAAKEIGELCATFGKVAELKPPAGNPQTNPSRAFDQEEHADLAGVVPDLGCDARAAARQLGGSP